jgi:hypothetical protein
MHWSSACRPARQRLPAEPWRWCLRAALAGLDAFYPQPNGASVLAEVVERLGSARPVDEAAIDLATYRGLQAPWNDWRHVVSRGRFWARVLADLLLGAKGGEP